LTRRSQRRKKSRRRSQMRRSLRRRNLRRKSQQSSLKRRLKTLKKVAWETLSKT